MTALADLARWLNEVFTGAIRDWWRTRNDPPPMLPDPVTWTARIPRYMVDDYQSQAKREGWEKIDVLDCELPDAVDMRHYREDGAYRWRDDSFQGF